MSLEEKSLQSHKSKFIMTLICKETLKQIKIFFQRGLIKNNHSECNIKCSFLSHQSLNAKREHLLPPSPKKLVSDLFSCLIANIILSPALLC